VLRDYYNARGVKNISVLVVDNETGALVSAIGNFDYFDHHSSQNYGSFSVLRSPGSILKPFLYAYLIGRGDLLPQSLLLDIPSKYENYTPQNFTGLYSGLVPAEEALSQSLNVPFVRELQKLGLDEFLAFLDAGGLHHMSPVQDLGLSAIIGAVEVNAFDLTQLYTALANGGQIKPLRHLQQDDFKPYGWLNPAAVYLTNEALAKRDRPDFPGGSASFRNLQRVKWKTGTSQDRRDAWSIGFQDKYTVAVWLGNLDMSSSPLLTGSQAAAPLMFRLLAMLKAPATKTHSTPYDHLAEVNICSFSGWRATASCPHTKRVLTVHQHPLSKPCPYYESILVDLDSGLRVTKQCDQGLRTGMKNVLSLPQDVLFWMRRSLRNLTPKPSFHAQCKTVPTEPGSIKIKQPALFSTYYLTQGRTSLNIPIEWESTSSLEDTACYIDGRRLDLGKMEFRRMIQVKAGKHHFFCADLFGKSDEVRFSVLSTQRHF
jgi:penicillin-binding protein 1C